MKKSNIIYIILITIIILLTGYIIYDKVVPRYNIIKTDKIDEEVSIIDNIKLDYVNIYLTSDGLSYIVPINKEKIDKLKINSNLKDRLTTLYNRAFYYDIYVNNYKIKGFRVKLDNDIKKIYKVNVNDNIYIIFLKENNTIGIFKYLEYYDLLDTTVIDNYNDLKNVKEIKDNKIIFEDGSSEKLKIE